MVLITAAVFARVAGFPFVLWDDTIELYQNGNFNPPSLQHLATLWLHPTLAIYVPMTDTVWTLLAMLARLPAPDPVLGGTLDPHVFHIANLAVHLLNVAMVFVILRLLVGRDLPAAAGALLFGIHPVQVESVAWASEMRGLLAACFSLAAILAYLLRTRVPKTTGRLLYAGALAAALLAVLSKPSAVGLPLALFAVDLFLLRRTFRSAALSAAPFLLSAVPLVLVTLAAQQVEKSLLTPPLTRPFIAGDTLAFYLAKLALPLGLGIDYGRKPGIVAGHWWGYVTWLAPAMVAALAWWLRRRAPWVAAGALIALAAVVPVIGLVPFAYQHYSDVADRYLYLALLGVSLVIAQILAIASDRFRWALPLAVAWLLTLAVLTTVQVGYWDGTIPLMTQALAVNPQSDVAYNNRGIAYARMHRYAEAKADFIASLRINPDRYDTHSNLGNVYLLEKDPGAAINEYKTSIALNPSWDESHANYGNALGAEGRYADAKYQFEIALRLNPTSTTARRGLEDMNAILARK